MPAKKPPPPDEKPQSERFFEAARKAEASDNPADFDRAFRQVMRGSVIPTNPSAGATKDDKERSGR
jgi:hypothetical protein